MAGLARVAHPLQWYAGVPLAKCYRRWLLVADLRQWFAGAFARDIGRP
jgi:hypothetical protein